MDRPPFRGGFCGLCASVAADPDTCSALGYELSVCTEECASSQTRSKLGTVQRTDAWITVEASFAVGMRYTEE